MVVVVFGLGAGAGGSGGLFFSRFLLPLRRSMSEQARSFKGDFSYFDRGWGIN